MNWLLKWAIPLAIAGALTSCSHRAAGDEVESRDIDQVWERPTTVLSWAQLFGQITQRNDIRRSAAIVIGLSDYANYWRPLEAPWYDARHVRDYLIHSGFDLVVTLTNRAATKENIRRYMEEILPNRVGKDDRFLFYFSGHGTQRELFGAVRGYLPMLDSGKDNWSSMIGMHELTQWSENLGQSRHSLFVLDACFSGLAGEQSKGAQSVNAYMDDLLRPGHFLITAGSANQISYADVGRWGGSLFTRAFLDGVEGAADSGTPEFPPDGVVSLTKLYDYVRRRIGAERESLPQIQQTPLISDLTPKSAGEFFFLAADREKVKPRFLENDVAHSLTQRKGYTVGSVDAADAESASAKVDRVYGDGLSDFPQWKLGRNLSDIGNYSWSDLPQATEIKTADVRYLWLKMSDLVPSFRDYGCISPTSYFVFAFLQQKLFRISIRFFDEGKCSSHSTWLTHFANSVGAPLQQVESIRYFDVVGKRVELLGMTTARQTVIDIVSADARNVQPLEQWLGFHK